jgi:hypothetical protein
MADIFISYSKGSAAHTEQLAKELQDKGFTVWYDTSLVPGDSFRDVIMSELAKARAAIVIWDAASVKSEWVCSEASRARARRILIPVRAHNIRSHDIPPPFDSLHTELLSNRAGIDAALAKLGVMPTVVSSDDGVAATTSVPDEERTALTSPRKPSIAVLPFPQHEWRSGAGVSCRWHGRGDYNRTLSHSPVPRNRTQFELRLQREGC